MGGRERERDEELGRRTYARHHAKREIPEDEETSDRKKESKGGRGGGQKSKRGEMGEARFGGEKERKRRESLE